VCVIGAGIGSILAVELGRRNLDVVLLDERPTILGGASDSQLARLHFGPHYGGDDGFAPDRLNTAQRCTLGALAWLRRYPEGAPTEGRWWQLITADSMTPPDDYLSFCDRLSAFQTQLAAADPLARELFGGPDQMFRRLDPREYTAHVAPDRVVLGVESRERVIDVRALRRSIERDLAGTSRVEVMLSTRVRSVRRGAETGFVLHLGSGELLGADLVVNCSAHDLGALGGNVASTRSMSTRLRLVAAAELPKSLRQVPSMFFHRGVLGNHTKLDGRTMRFVSEAICNFRNMPGVGVPEAWRRLMMHPEDPTNWVDGVRAALALPCAVGPASDRPSPLEELTEELTHMLRADHGRVGSALRDRIGSAILDGYSELVPAVRGCGRVIVTPTASVDLGCIDIWDSGGPVHRRDWFTDVDDAGLVSVHPGKFTFGALAAEEAVAQVSALLAGELRAGQTRGGQDDRRPAAGEGEVAEWR